MARNDISHGLTAGETIETTQCFLPRFNADGLITAIAAAETDSAVLMVAHMNADALRLTMESGEAHFWSRSRGRLWKKGETSGHVLRVREIRVDCDQDVLLLIVDPAGPACHTDARSCFYRRVTEKGDLAPVG